MRSQLPRVIARAPMEMKYRLDAHGPFPAIRTTEPALKVFECIHIGGTVKLIPSQLPRLAAEWAVGTSSAFPKHSRTLFMASPPASGAPDMLEFALDRWGRSRSLAQAAPWISATRPRS
jgi:hypothetical protein